MIRSRTDQRRILTDAHIPEARRLIVCDASFIGLSKVLERPMTFARAGRRPLLALIKPQFEEGARRWARAAWCAIPPCMRGCVRRRGRWLEASGWSVAGVTESPITGPEGNIEFLVAASETGHDGTIIVNGRFTNGPSRDKGAKGMRRSVGERDCVQGSAANVVPALGDRDRALILLLGFASGRARAGGVGEQLVRRAAKARADAAGLGVSVAGRRCTSCWLAVRADPACARRAWAGVALRCSRCSSPHLAWDAAVLRRIVIGAALVVIVAMLLLSIVTTVLFGRIRTAAAWLMVPYMVWISFAGC